jgi:hypothetical protein
MSNILASIQPTLFDDDIQEALDRHPSIRREADVRALVGTTLAARKWSAEQIAAVDQAIELCVKFCPTFTADDIWARLPKDFPVTKGLAGRLKAASTRGICHATDQTRKSTRGGEHDHGQRLVVWRSTPVIGGMSPRRSR